MNQSAGKLKEIEGQLQNERARSEELAKQLSDAMGQLARAKESEAQLATAHQRVSDLEAQVTKLEPQALRISSWKLRSRQNRIK